MWLVFKFDTLTLFWLFVCLFLLKPCTLCTFFTPGCSHPQFDATPEQPGDTVTGVFLKGDILWIIGLEWVERRKKTTKTPPYKITKMNYKLLWTACFHSVCDVRSGVCVLIFFLRAFASWSTVRCWKTPVKTLPSFCIRGRGLTKPPSGTIWARGKQY